MTRHVFVLVPSFHPTGPVKGAVALANALAAERPVTLAALRGGPGADADVDPRVRQMSLAEQGGFWGRVRSYRGLLYRAGGRSNAASISLGLSADAANLFCRSAAVTCASVRGNLPAVYPKTYGPLGRPLGMAHLAALRRIDHVVAMTSAMARQVAGYIGRAPEVIGNFVDEPALEPFRERGPRDGPLRLVFLGSLTPLKQPMMILDALASLRRSGERLQLDVVGDGPLREMLIDRVAREGLAEQVTIHGHLTRPYHLVARADALVLPSLSEGMPRAALEALYLGVPCVLRHADGNDELIRAGVNGTLFAADGELPAAILACARMGRAHGRRESLLPPESRQRNAARSYLALVESPS